MTKSLEILAPGGDIDSIKAAIAAGADAIYCGLNKYNARNRAENISFDNLLGILHLAHKYNCQVYLTLNIIVIDSEIPDLINLLNKLVNTSIDGVILQDIGLFYLIKRYFPQLKIHASTQLTTHNKGQLKALSKIRACRVNLSRELSLDEITELNICAKQHQLQTEIFVHGSNCLSFSGLCYISSMLSGNSGNRGRCSQPCRDEYIITPKGHKFPLNLKDNSAFADVKDIAEAGVHSLKIEGRIKKFHYVYTVVEAWRKQVDQYLKTGTINSDKSELYKVFNREFTNAFLKNSIHKDMYIDNPRDHSAIHFTKSLMGNNEASLENAKKYVYDLRTDIIQNVRKVIDAMSIDKIPLVIKISGKKDEKLLVSIISSAFSFNVTTNSSLRVLDNANLDKTNLLKRLKAIEETVYYIEELNIEALEPNLFLPFKELTTLKKDILLRLNEGKQIREPITIPKLPKTLKQKEKPKISALLSNIEDAKLIPEINADFFYELPSDLANKIDIWINIFQENANLIPWFSSVLIGNNFDLAIELITKLKPKLIVANNLGVGYEACKSGIPWIAGPQLNIANSYCLISLKENFNCVGAFISNELGKRQLRGIKCPDNFKLYYSTYHPVELITSRQCLFHQVTGCEKVKIDGFCLSDCSKQSSITNLDNENFIIDKSKNNYHKIYYPENYLNLEIQKDLPNLIDVCNLDFRDIATKTQLNLPKNEIIALFKKFLLGDSNAGQLLKENILYTQNIQYHKGI